MPHMTVETSVSPSPHRIRLSAYGFHKLSSSNMSFPAASSASYALFVCKRRVSSSSPFLGSASMATSTANR